MLKELGLLSIVLLIALPIANAQTAFQVCYNAIAKEITHIRVLTNTTEAKQYVGNFSSELNLNDPEIKQWITNHCS